MMYSKHMTKQNKRSLYITILMIVCGLAVGAFGRSIVAGKDRGNDRLSVYQDIVIEYEALQAQNQRLVEQNELLEAKKNLLIGNLQGLGSYDQIIRERENYALLAGLTAVEGAGIRVTLNDRLEYDPTLHPVESIVHDKTVLHVIEILRSNGAQALAFNGIRLTAVPQIGCIGPTILCYDYRQMPPYIIEAIGPVEEMKNAIAGDAYLKHITSPEIGIRMNLETNAVLELPSFSRSGDYLSLITLLEAK